MPLKASIGMSRKVGQENYGSLGANCQLEVELDASLVEDAEAFHDRIRKLYALVNQSVNDQLDRQAQRNGQTRPSNNNQTDTPASNRQIKYLLDIARQQHNMTLADVGEFCQETVGKQDVYQLSKRQASQVIDQLTGKSSNGRRPYAPART